MQLLTQGVSIEKVYGPTPVAQDMVLRIMQYDYRWAKESIDFLSYRYHKIIFYLNAS